MTRVMLTVFLMAAVTLMGVLITAALVAGFDTLCRIVVASVVDFVLAIPVSW